MLLLTPAPVVVIFLAQGAHSWVCRRDCRELHDPRQSPAFLDLSMLFLLGLYTRYLNPKTKKDPKRNCTGKVQVARPPKTPLRFGTFDQLQDGHILPGCYARLTRARPGLVDQGLLGCC